MTTPPQPPQPPTTPPPPPGGYGAPPPPPAAGVPDGQAQKSSLPTISLVLGILSLVCLGFLAGIPAIITGFMGRKKAKMTGEGAGMSLAGIITGAIGTVLSIAGAIAAVIILAAGGAAVVSAISSQVTVANELNPASTAAEAYGAENGSYAGLTTEALSDFGFVPSNNVKVTAVPLRGGTSYCIEGAPTDDSSGKIHVPVSGGSSIDIDVSGTFYQYSLGGCPPAS
jgi:hypothetical protein